MKVLYDYEAADLDEITIKEGQLVELLNEGGLNAILPRCLRVFFTFPSSDESGWWTGKVGGKEGFFPGEYVKKMRQFKIY